MLIMILAIATAVFGALALKVLIALAPARACEETMRPVARAGYKIASLFYTPTERPLGPDIAHVPG